MLTFPTMESYKPMNFVPFGLIILAQIERNSTGGKNLLFFLETHWKVMMFGG